MHACLWHWVCNNWLSDWQHCSGKNVLVQRPVQLWQDLFTYDVIDQRPDTGVYCIPRRSPSMTPPPLSSGVTVHGRMANHLTRHGPCQTPQLVVGRWRHWLTVTGGEQETVETSGNVTNVSQHVRNGTVMNGVALGSRWLCWRIETASCCEAQNSNVFHQHV